MISQQSFLRVIWATMCIPLLVIFLPLAIYVKRTTIRLPEAEGERSNGLDNKNAIRLLHIGESTVAGVGVESITSGFTANIANDISTQTNTPVAWAVFGENGIRLHELNAQLPLQIKKLNARRSGSDKNKDYDLAIVTMGVNDSTKLTSVKHWRAELINTIKVLKANTTGPICFTQVPPLWQFPALPTPLKQLLGIRSLILDNELKAFCDENNGVYYIGSTMNVEKEMMATDGYHPSKLGYQQWAEQISDQITPTLNLNEAR